MARKRAKSLRLGQAPTRPDYLTTGDGGFDARVNRVRFKVAGTHKVPAHVGKVFLRDLSIDPVHGRVRGAK